MYAWDRQPNEPDLWFDRFRSYLLMGSGRSVLGCYNATNPTKTEKARTLPKSWRDAAKTWNWRDRASSFDRSIQAENLDLWRQRRQQIRDRQWTLSEALLAKAEKMLEVPLNDQKWGAGDAAKFAALGVELARQAAELGNFEFNQAARIVIQHGFQIRDRFQHGAAPDPDVGWVGNENELEENLDKY